MPMTSLPVRALERLIDRHGQGNYSDCTLKLTFPRNPNGLYLVKGGGSDVWRRFGIPHSWRKPQGLIFGKRCGTTQNIGPAARRRWKEQQEGSNEAQAIAEWINPSATAVGHTA
jgi:hypothetical protein